MMTTCKRQQAAPERPRARPRPVRPRGRCAEVRELVAALRETRLGRWDAIDPRHTAVLLHSGLSARDLIDRSDDAGARDELRVALEAMRQALAAIAEREPVGDDRRPKEIVQWLAERTEV